MTPFAQPETNLLNRPFVLPNGVELPNRLAKAAMSEALGTYDNHATSKIVELYRRWAKSGIGLMFTGNVMIDRKALGEPGNIVIEDESDLPILKQWANAAREEGVSLWVQLNHPGKQSPKGLNQFNLAAEASVGDAVSKLHKLLPENEWGGSSVSSPLVAYLDGECNLRSVELHLHPPCQVGLAVSCSLLTARPASSGMGQFDVKAREASG